MGRQAVHHLQQEGGRGLLGLTERPVVVLHDRGSLVMGRGGRLVERPVVVGNDRGSLVSSLRFLEVVYNIILGVAGASMTTTSNTTISTDTTTTNTTAVTTTNYCTTTLTNPSTTPTITS